MRKCKICEGRGWNWMQIGEEDIEKEPCEDCDGKGEIAEEGDGVPCSECEDGMLVIEGSPFENENGEDEKEYKRCDKCKALYDEKGRLLHRGGQGNEYK